MIYDPTCWDRYLDHLADDTATFERDKWIFMGLLFLVAICFYVMGIFAERAAAQIRRDEERDRLWDTFE